ncbi:hypothetical protein [Planctobacterium marinum]|uniref:Uncharacterized protein n=1 Tax=Planctobacterium marinum TaxID=1631968 RepID=A0AA48HL81_9ALTE|nr:hypothetical protein MACH26_00330 [Planctobacterium marinum]
MTPEPHYASYNLAELLEVQENIDKERFPNRAAKVDDEIQKRLAAGEKPDYEASSHQHDEERDSVEFLLDFQGEEQQPLRKFFLASIAIIHIIIGGLIYDRLNLPEYQSLPQYLINVEKTQCLKMGSRDHRYYDFVVLSWGYKFYAIDVNQNLCTKLYRNIEKETDLKIWHQDGVIFHMMAGDKVLLSQQYLRNNYRSNQVEHLLSWYMIPLLFWVLMFKSVVNAIRPGTFIAE